MSVPRPCGFLIKNKNIFHSGGCWMFQAPLLKLQLQLLFIPTKKETLMDAAAGAWVAVAEETFWTVRCFAERTACCWMMHLWTVEAAANTELLQAAGCIFLGPWRLDEEGCCVLSHSRVAAPSVHKQDVGPWCGWKEWPKLLGISSIVGSWFYCLLPSPPSKLLVEEICCIIHVLDHHDVQPFSICVWPLLMFLGGNLMKPDYRRRYRRSYLHQHNGGATKKLVFFGNAARAFDLKDLLRASAEVLGKGSGAGGRAGGGSEEVEGFSGLAFHSISPFSSSWSIINDDNDNEGGVGILHQNLTSTSSALHWLLRKLGAGLDDLLPSSTMVICEREERIL
ncbi:hypothetical protein V8G54_013513 [Vigna mungo]|uniref:Uncharacterized protein n=1 Tax=Vigna mungo TaxID=3915 RepID=A0AAQ3S3B9_VIGMU